MAREEEGGSSLAGDGLGAALALNPHHALDSRAAAYLEEQTRLARLQAEDLEREDKLRHWSLVVRHSSDVMKVVFELAVAIIVIGIAIVLGGAVWSAAHDNGLVIESFSVPPDFAERGLTGQVIASQLLDRLSAMQSETTSMRPASSYKNNWGDDIKVQIPNTGVSVGEFNSYLHDWLGNRTHIFGEVFRTPTGIAVTARVGGDAGATVDGKDSALAALIQKAAEAVYEKTQPYRYGQYELRRGHRMLEPGANQKAQAVFMRLTKDDSALERAWAYLGLANLYSNAGDDRRAIEVSWKAVAAKPDFLLAYTNIDDLAESLSHDEEAIQADRRAIDLLQRGGPEIAPRAVAISLLATRGDLALFLGDFKEVIADEKMAEGVPDFLGSLTDLRITEFIAYALMHDRAKAQNLFRDIPPRDASSALAVKAYTGRLLAWAWWGLQDWPALLKQTRVVEPMFAQLGRPVRNDLVATVWWMQALAEAETGNFAGADALIAKTPPDCTFCVLARGRIRTAEKKYGAAAFWFAEAARQAPSEPYANAYWGEMLLRKGDLDDAIAKFSIANRKGPHFADPLEMWGEALIRNNRSDLALAKFEEADKYAPAWGRLHLKWGEALLWSGDNAAAQKQFAMARKLDLTPSDKSELTRIQTGDRKTGL